MTETGSCAACYLCINRCPEQAIQISVSLLLIHLGLSVALPFLCWILTRFR